MPKKEKSAKQHAEDVSEKLLKADLARIVKKVRGGGSLSASERNFLERNTGEKAEERIGNYVSSINKLADALGVTRKTIYEWRKEFADEIPEKTTNNEYDVGAWRALAKRHERKVAGGEDDAPHAPEGEIDLQEAKRLHEIEKLEERRIKNAIARGEWMPTDLVREKWNGAVKRAIALLRSKFENELPPICSGADAVSIQKENQSAIDEVCKLLSEG